jgi:hypothetical protein
MADSSLSLQGKPIRPAEAVQCLLSRLGNTIVDQGNNTRSCTRNLKLPLQNSHIDNSDPLHFLTTDRTIIADMIPAEIEGEALHIKERHGKDSVKKFRSESEFTWLRPVDNEDTSKITVLNFNILGKVVHIDSNPYEL